jgi:hypothetical protein
MTHKEEERAIALDDFLHEFMAAYADQANGKQTRLRERPPEDPMGRYVPFGNNRLHHLERLMQDQHHLAQGELARALRALETALRHVLNGLLPPSTLAPDNLPDEAQGVRSLAAAYHTLLGRVWRQAVDDTVRQEQVRLQQAMEWAFHQVLARQPEATGLLFALQQEVEGAIRQERRQRTPSGVLSRHPDPGPQGGHP